MSAKDVIIALDFPTREETLSFLDRFHISELTGGAHHG